MTWWLGLLPDNDEDMNAAMREYAIAMRKLYLEVDKVNILENWVDELAEHRYQDIEVLEN